MSLKQAKVETDRKSLPQQKQSSMCYMRNKIELTVGV